MAVTYGFYDSLNHDRLYNAQQMSAIFDGIINDGVFMSVGNQFHTVAGTGMQVIVKSGRAWFNSTWTLNDAEYPLSIDAADVLLTRIDAVVLEVNSEVATRANTIKVVKGTPASTPAKPTLTNTATIHQHALAYVTVAKNTTAITNSMIEIVVGKTETPYVTAILQTTDITDLFKKWENDFQVWFETVKGTLDGDVALNLQNQIDHCVKKADKATSEDIEAGTADKWIDSATLKQTEEPVGTIKQILNNDEFNEKYIKCDGRSINPNVYVEYNKKSGYYVYPMFNSMSIEQASGSYSAPSMTKFLASMDGRYIAGAYYTGSNIYVIYCYDTETKTQTFAKRTRECIFLSIYNNRIDWIESDSHHYYMIAGSASVMDAGSTEYSDTYSKKVLLEHSIDRTIWVRFIAISGSIDTSGTSTMVIVSFNHSDNTVSVNYYQLSYGQVQNIIFCPQDKKLLIASMVKTGTKYYNILDVNSKTISEYNENTHAKYKQLFAQLERYNSSAQYNNCATFSEEVNNIFYFGSGTTIYRASLDNVNNIYVVKSLTLTGLSSSFNSAGYYYDGMSNYFILRKQHYNILVMPGASYITMFKDTDDIILFSPYSKNYKTITNIDAFVSKPIIGFTGDHWFGYYYNVDTDNINIPNEPLKWIKVM